MKFFRQTFHFSDLLLVFFVISIGTLGGFGYRLSDTAWLIRWGLKNPPIRILVSSRSVFPEKIESELKGYLNTPLQIEEFGALQKPAGNPQADFDLVVGPYCELSSDTNRIDWNSVPDLGDSLSPDFQSLLNKNPSLFPLMWKFEPSTGMQMIAIQASDQKFVRSMIELILSPQFMRYWAQQTGYQSTLAEEASQANFRRVPLKDLLSSHPLECSVPAVNQ